MIEFSDKYKHFIFISTFFVCVNHVTGVFNQLRNCEMNFLNKRSKRYKTNRSCVGNVLRRIFAFKTSDWLRQLIASEESGVLNLEEIPRKSFLMVLNWNGNNQFYCLKTSFCFSEFNDHCLFTMALVLAICILILLFKALFTRSVENFVLRAFFVALTEALSVKVSYVRTIKNFQRISKKQTLVERSFLRYM